MNLPLRWPSQAPVMGSDSFPCESAMPYRITGQCAFSDTPAYSIGDNRICMVRGDRVKERLEAAGLNQSQLARRIGLTQGTIAKLISGKAQGSSHLHRIARELRTTPAYLTGETDDPSADVPDTMLSHDEAELITDLRQLEDDDRDAVKKIVDRLLGRPSGPRSWAGQRPPRPQGRISLRVAKG